MGAPFGSYSTDDCSWLFSANSGFSVRFSMLPTVRTCPPLAFSNLLTLPVTHSLCLSPQDLAVSRRGQSALWSRFVSSMGPRAWSANFPWFSWLHLCWPLPARQLSILITQNSVSERASGRGSAVQISGNMAGMFPCPRATLQEAQNVTRLGRDPCMQPSGLGWNLEFLLVLLWAKSKTRPVPRVVEWTVLPPIQSLRAPWC